MTTNPDAGIEGLRLLAADRAAEIERERAERTSHEGLQRAKKHLASTFKPTLAEAVSRDPRITTAEVVRLMLDELESMSPTRRRRVEREMGIAALAGLAEQFFTAQREQALAKLGKAVLRRQKGA